MTVGAAASLVLTVTPALVAPTTATATQNPPSNHRSQASPTVKGAALAYRSRIRAAVAARDAATKRANRAFSEAVSPLRGAMLVAQASATSPSEVQAARVRYGQATLAAKVEFRAALEAARVDYVEAAEEARIMFLVARGASSDTVAHARFRQALNHATAEYQYAITSARDAHRVNGATARTTALLGASDDTLATPTPESLRYATADATAVFRSQLSSARHTYQSKLAVAKRILSTSAAR